jgi:hypothetical protein
LKSAVAFSSFLETRIVMDAHSQFQATDPASYERIEVHPFPLAREEHCGGGTMSFCQRTESAQWPKYVDERGDKRCCVCKCRGPMIDKMIDTLPGGLAELVRLVKGNGRPTT